MRSPGAAGASVSQSSGPLRSLRNARDNAPPVRGAPRSWGQDSTRSRSPGGLGSQCSTRSRTPNPAGTKATSARTVLRPQELGAFPSTRGTLGCGFDTGANSGERAARLGWRKAPGMRRRRGGRAGPATTTFCMGLGGRAGRAQGTAGVENKSGHAGVSRGEAGDGRPSRDLAGRAGGLPGLGRLLGLARGRAAPSKGGRWGAASPATTAQAWAGGTGGRGEHTGPLRGKGKNRTNGSATKQGTAGKPRHTRAGSRHERG